MLAQFGPYLDPRWEPHLEPMEALGSPWKAMRGNLGAPWGSYVVNPNSVTRAVPSG